MTRWRFNVLFVVGNLITVFFIINLTFGAKHQPLLSYHKKTVLTVGYLTATKGELKDKQGLAISGALTMALDEVNKRLFFPNRMRNREHRLLNSPRFVCVFFFHFVCFPKINNDRNLLPNVTLALRWTDTRGDTVLATRAITEMICDGVATFFGPEGPCYVEAIVSQSRNIPMISYVNIFHLFLSKKSHQKAPIMKILSFLSLHHKHRNVRIIRHLRFQRLHVRNHQILR